MTTKKIREVVKSCEDTNAKATSVGEKLDELVKKIRQLNTGVRQTFTVIEQQKVRK